MLISSHLAADLARQRQADLRRAAQVGRRREEARAPQRAAHAKRAAHVRSRLIDVVDRAYRAATASGRAIEPAGPALPALIHPRPVGCPPDPEPQPC